MTTILFQKMQSDDSSARSPDVEENSSYPTGRFASLVVMMMRIMMMLLMMIMTVKNETLICIN